MKIEDFGLLIVGPRNRPSMPACVTVNTCSKLGWHADLSPFLIGPCRLWDGRESRTMENAWQFSKVYRQHCCDGKPNQEWRAWSDDGFAAPAAHRYPMGKGARPVGSWWNNELLGYVAARRKIYFPLYRDAVRGTGGFRRLEIVYAERRKLMLPLQLWDFDARPHKGLMFSDVMNDETKIMGHAFVLAAMLAFGPTVTPEEIDEFDRCPVLPFK